MRSRFSSVFFLHNAKLRHFVSFTKHILFTHCCFFTKEYVIVHCKKNPFRSYDKRNFILLKFLLNQNDKSRAFFLQKFHVYRYMDAQLEIRELNAHSHSQSHLNHIFYPAHMCILYQTC